MTDLAIPAHIIKGHDAAGQEWYVDSLTNFTGQMSMQQLARILDAVQDELRWRQQQVEDLDAVRDH